MGGTDDRVCQRRSGQVGVEAKSLSGSCWLCAPNCADGKQATPNPRPTDSHVAVITHDATDHPARKLLGCIEFPPVVMPERLELGSDDRHQRRDRWKTLPRERTILGVPRWGTDDCCQSPAQRGSAVRLEPGGHHRSLPDTK